MVTLIVLAVLAGVVFALLTWLRNRWSQESLQGTLYEVAARWTIPRHRSADSLCRAMRRAQAQLFVELPSGRKVAAPAILYRVSEADFDKLDRRYDLGLLARDLASTYMNTAHRSGWELGQEPVNIVIEADPVLLTGWVPRGRVDRENGQLVSELPPSRPPALSPAASDDAVRVPGSPQSPASHPTPVPGARRPDIAPAEPKTPGERKTPSGRIPRADSGAAPEVVISGPELPPSVRDGSLPPAARPAEPRSARPVAGPVPEPVAKPSAGAGPARQPMPGDSPVGGSQEGGSRGPAPQPSSYETQVMVNPQEQTPATELIGSGTELMGTELVAEPTARLVLCDGEVIHLTGQAMVGRDPGCTIVLKESKVSRHHARIGEDANGWFVEDTHSSNGTWVNEQRVNPAERVPLVSGDSIAFGDRSTPHEFCVSPSA